jgi:hypothetical protein
MNPFPEPDTISKNLNKEIRSIISLKVEQKSLEFFDILSTIELAVADNDYEKAVIYAYYCTNIMNNKAGANQEEKDDLISFLKKCLEKIKPKDYVSSEKLIEEDDKDFLGS